MAQTTPNDLSKSLGDMSSDELLAWGAKELAGAALGGIGSFVVGQLLSSMFSSGSSLDDQFAAQLEKMREIFRDVIEENELRELKADLSGLTTTMNDYREVLIDNPNSPLDRLITATTEANNTYAHAVSLGRPAIKSFLIAASLRICVLGERVRRFPASAAGERRNIKRALNESITHGQQMVNELKRHMLDEVYNPIFNNGGRFQGTFRYMPTLWIWRDNLLERVPPFGYTAEVLTDSYRNDGVRVNVPGRTVWIREWPVSTPVSMSNEERAPIEAAALAEAEAYREQERRWIWGIVENDMRLEESISRWQMQLSQFR